MKPKRHRAIKKAFYYQLKHDNYVFEAQQQFGLRCVKNQKTGKYYLIF